MHGRGPSNINSAPLLSWQGFIIDYGDMLQTFIMEHVPDSGLITNTTGYYLDRMHPSYSGQPIRRLALLGYILWLQDDDQAEIYAVYNRNCNYRIPESYPVI